MRFFSLLQIEVNEIVFVKNDLSLTFYFASFRSLILEQWFLIRLPLTPVWQYQD